ncbi:MAG: family N-acetyltransferase [Marmoricola sp.]|nr:family N-acetyltransferase [Marmoricola sp.]
MAGMTTTAPHLVEPELRTVDDASFGAFTRAYARGFEEDHHPETEELDRRVLGGRSFGFAVGERWVGTCGSLARRLVVPGGEAVPTAAVTGVTVAAPFRRRGLLSRMMTHELELCVARGEPLAALWASESVIYGRFGYGPAADRLVLSGTSRRLEFLPDVVVEGSVDDVGREEFLAAARAVHAAAVPSRPGAFVRDDEVWEFALFDLEFARRGAMPMHHLLHHAADGTVDGFATYRFKEGTSDEEGEVRIKDLVAESPTAYAGLWRYLLDLDLTRTFRLWSAPVDEPLRHLVRDARAVHTEVTDNLYVRLVDVATALSARSYAADLDVVLEVTDPQLGANTGRWRVTATAGGRATVTRVEDAPDLSLGVLELGTAYLGGPRLADLARAGRVREHTPGALAAASTAFGWLRAPYCPDMF